ncbi:MAG: ABC transporter ATP-binding protein [Lentisphaerota bacterium]
MIEFQDVTIIRGKKTILSNISFTINRGEKSVIIGQSGCGKTSLLLAVMGFCTIPSGTMKVNGSGLTLATLSSIRSQIAYIPQEPVLGSANVLEAIMFPFEFKANRDMKPDSNKVKEHLKKFGLGSNILEKRCADVSGGEKQRIVIARALMMNKSIFLADEVTTGLDAANSELVWNTFNLPDLTVLSVSHDPLWIEKQQSAYKVENGKLLKI